jgi:SAM-dependent methyltransferase
MAAVFAPWPREATRTELIDAPGTLPELGATLRDIARLNRLGATRGLFAHLAPFFARHDGRRPLRVLDIGTGAGDIPAHLVRWARARGRAVSVLALDLSPHVLACALPTVRDLPEVRLVAGDALRPPLRPGGVDVALSSLTLHHLPEDGVAALLRLMADVSRLGFVVSDLRRTRLTYAAVWLATRLVSSNRVTRHDGPLSVRRAYTAAELGALAARAGVPGVRWRAAPAFRLIGVYAPATA